MEVVHAMKAHELAKLLFAGPDLPVYVNDLHSYGMVSPIHSVVNDHAKSMGEEWGESLFSVGEPQIDSIPLIVLGQTKDN